MTHIPSNILKDWRVVVVDDDDDSLEVARRVVQHYGAEVHIARNGRDGLELIRQVLPKLVISDIAMPQLNGWEMIEAMRKDFYLREIPVVAVTAYAQPSDRARAFALGFQNFVTKPLTAQVLMQQILKVVQDSD